MPGMPDGLPCVCLCMPCMQMVCIPEAAGVSSITILDVENLL